MQNNQFTPGFSGPVPPMGGGAGIDVFKILSALWRNILLIVLAALIGGSTMLGYTWFFTKPAYTASVLAYINKSSVSISGADLVLGNSEDAISAYVTILNSRTTLEEIAETAGVPYDPATLKEMIKATPSADRASFVTISVTSGNPVEAELIANTVAAVLPTRVSDIVEGSTLRVVDYAVVPAARSTSSLVKNFCIGLAAGGLAVAAVIALTVYIRMIHAPVISSSSDLTQNYPEYPLLGIIRDLSYSDRMYRYSDYGYSKYSGYYSDPDEKSGKRKKQLSSTPGSAKKSKKSDTKYFCEHVPFSSREDYKRLRTNICSSLASDGTSHVLAVTSAQPSDGKSLTAINLAFSFAQMPDKHVLLIDCDMRRPSVASRLSFAQAPGLSNLLSGEEGIGDKVKNTYTPSNSSQPFDVLTSGSISPNPSELLSSNRMVRLMEKLKKYYDYIILDLPPVGAVTDAQVAATLADGMLIVVRESCCTRPVMDECLTQLRIANAGILGFVLNGSVEMASRGYRYKAYNKYGKRYGYGYGYDHGYGYGGYPSYGYGHDYGYYGYGYRHEAQSAAQNGEKSVRYRSNLEDAKPVMDDNDLSDIL